MLKEMTIKGLEPQLNQMIEKHEREKVGTGNGTDQQKQLKADLDEQVRAKTAELEQKKQEDLQTEKDKLARRVEEQLQREKELLAKYFATEKEALERNHQSQTGAVKAFLNKEMNLKLGLKDEEIRELKRKLEQKKETLRKLAERNRELEQQFRREKETHIESVRSQFEAQKQNELGQKMSELERNFKAKEEEMQRRKERENQEKIELVINRFSDEMLDKEKLIETLSRKKEELEKKVEHLEEKLRQAKRRSQVDVLKTQIEDLRKTVREAQEQLAQSQVGHASAARQNQILSEQLANLKVNIAQLQMEKKGLIRETLTEELEKTQTKEYEEKKNLKKQLEKLEEKKEIEVLNERNRAEAVHERRSRKQEEKYKEQLKTIEAKVVNLLETRAKEIRELREQVQAKERLARKYEELLEKQRKDFLIPS